MFLAHGTGIDDIVIMVGVIVLGLLLLRRSERSVRARAEEAEAGRPIDETGALERPDPDDSEP